MELSNYLKIYPSSQEKGSFLIYSTIRGAILQIPEVLTKEILAGKFSSADCDVLVKQGILVPDALAEREQMRGYFDWVNNNSNTFTALVALNLDCNLACPYCYEDHFRGKSYMDDATADLLIEMILKGFIAKGKNVVLVFYGGEALLSVPLIRRISQPLLEATASAGTSYSFNIVTNGTLLNRSLVDELLPLGLKKVNITIDGPPDIHNKQRPFVSGKGSFDIIIANIKAISSLVQIQLGGNFTYDNYMRFPELLDILTAESITPDMLSVVQFSPVVPKAGEAGMPDFTMGCACNSEPWLLEAVLFLREEILKHGWKAPKPKLTGCMVLFENDMVVGYDGSLYKCPAFMGWPELRIGSLTDGINDYTKSHQTDSWKNEECLKCPYLPLCFGGCRFLNRLNTGSIDGIDCRRAYLDATLEKTIRQDLQFR